MKPNEEKIKTLTEILNNAVTSYQTSVIATWTDATQILPKKS